MASICASYCRQTHRAVFEIIASQQTKLLAFGKTTRVMLCACMLLHCRQQAVGRAKLRCKQYIECMMKLEYSCHTAWQSQSHMYNTCMAGTKSYIVDLVFQEEMLSHSTAKRYAFSFVLPFVSMSMQEQAILLKVTQDQHNYLGDRQGSLH